MKKNRRIPNYNNSSEWKSYNLMLELQIMKILQIPSKNYENRENHRIPRDNYENHENHRIPCDNY